MEKGKLNQATDRELLLLLKKSNRIAFGELYSRYWQPMYRSAFNVVRDQDAVKDILQDIFLDLWRRREELYVQQLLPYLLQCVKFQVAKHLRGAKLTQQQGSSVDALSFANITENDVYYNELNHRLTEIIEALPEKCREVFYMSRFHNLSNEEIAEKMCLSQRTVEWHISNALKHVRASLDNVAVCFPLLFAIVLNG